MPDPDNTHHEDAHAYAQRTGLTWKERDAVETSLSRMHVTYDPTPSAIHGVEHKEVAVMHRLLSLLDLDRRRPLENRVLVSLFNAGRTICGLRPEDIVHEARSQEEQAEVEAAHRAGVKERRKQLHGMAERVQGQRDHLHALSAGQEDSGNVVANAKDRLAEDAKWVSDALRQLRDLQT